MPVLLWAGNYCRQNSVAPRGFCLLVDPDVGNLLCPGPHAARCTLAAGITPTRHLEAAARTARVQIWSLAHTTQDASTKWNWGSRPQRKEGASLQLQRAFGRWAAAAFCVGC